MKEQSSSLKDSLLGFRHSNPTFRTLTKPGLSLSVGGGCHIWVKGAKKTLPRNTDVFHRSRIYWLAASCPLFTLLTLSRHALEDRKHFVSAPSLGVHVTRRQTYLICRAFQRQETTPKNFPSSSSTQIPKNSFACCDLKLSIVFPSSLHLLPLSAVFHASPNAQSANFLSYLCFFFPCLPQTVRPTKPEIAEKAEITQRGETGALHDKIFSLE